MKRLFLGLTLTLIIAAGCKFGDKKPRLPILGERSTVLKNQKYDTVYHTIPDIGTYVNQYADEVTAGKLAGNIYVADFFFTSCPSICPVMHRNMLKVYNEFKDTTDFKIISYTIDPKYDSAAVLKKYADKLGIDGDKWWLLQGDKEQTYAISKSYLVTTPQADEKEKFVHDGYFVLVDKQRRIRGMYDGTDEAQVAKLIADIKILRAEPGQQTTL